MSESIVIESLNETQVNDLWKSEVIRFKGNLVFCPMCEVWHENNTFCQMNSTEGDII